MEAGRAGSGGQQTQHSARLQWSSCEDRPGQGERPGPGRAEIWGTEGMPCGPPWGQPGVTASCSRVGQLRGYGRNPNLGGWAVSPGTTPTPLSALHFTPQPPVWFGAKSEDTGWGHLYLLGILGTLSAWFHVWSCRVRPWGPYPLTAPPRRLYVPHSQVSIPTLPPVTLSTQCPSRELRSSGGRRGGHLVLGQQQVSLSPCRQCGRSPAQMAGDKKGTGYSHRGAWAAAAAACKCQVLTDLQ